MHKLKRWLVLGAIPLLTVVLTACKRTTTTTLKPPTGFFGIFYKWVGLPLQHLMDWIAPWFGKASGYGIAIILITLAVRLILLPAMLRQQKNMTISQEKMKVLKPQLDIIQAQMKKSLLARRDIAAQPAHARRLQEKRHQHVAVDGLLDPVDSAANFLRPVSSRRLFA
nr:YidC/Oxa1 family membrane protein insertase [Lacticaseibacillus nasuensis]